MEGFHGPKKLNPCIIMIQGIWSNYLVEEKPVGSKWVFNKNMNAAGQVEKFKSQLVGKGYSQIEGFDFRYIFSLLQN
jgi:hypothetical protein